MLAGIHSFADGGDVFLSDFKAMITLTTFNGFSGDILCDGETFCALRACDLIVHVGGILDII